jgi:DnaJ like chaperone protein
MLNAQNAFRQEQGSSQGSYQRAGQQVPRADELALAYQALGVEKTATDAEIKKAYRKLMSEYHPDKLIGQGLPEDMIKAATERAQEIQAAYDLIKKSR